MSESEEEKIMQDIAESGLPCEIDASNRLKAAGWAVIHREPFIDEDTGKIRYGDIQAFKHVPDLPQIGLFIECCSSEKPWVFYGSWVRHKRPSIVPRHLPSLGLKLEVFNCSHQTRNDIFEGTIPYEPFKKGKGHDIFDASMKAIKALNYHLSSYQKFEKEFRIHVIRILYPMIVFDGHLFCLLQRKGKYLPLRANYVRYKLLYEQRESRFCNFLIDVVTKSDLTDYLTLIEEEHDALREFQKDHGSFLE